MASKQKIYAVKKGNKEGLFYTWEECQAAIEGFSSPDYKSFLTKEEAEAYLEDRLYISSHKQLSNGYDHTSDYRKIN